MDSTGGPPSTGVRTMRITCGRCRRWRGRLRLRDHARITSQPPTWRRLSVCRVPTPRDALWSTPGRRPDESGRGRHECRRHIAHAANVKLFLRGPLAYRKIVRLVEFAQWHSRKRDFGRDKHGEKAGAQHDNPGEFRPYRGGITIAESFARHNRRYRQDKPAHYEGIPRDTLYLLAAPTTPLADPANPVAVKGAQDQNPDKAGDHPDAFLVHVSQNLLFGLSRSCQYTPGVRPLCCSPELPWANYLSRACVFLGSLAKTRS